MKKVIFILLTCVLMSCSHKQEKLPFLGNSIVSGNETTYPKIKDFSFIDQDSAIVTNKTFRNKIYVADFIFLSCPTICPKMNTELNLVYTAFKDNPEVGFLSHTIDPERDSIKRLKEYTIAKGLNKNWHFVTGNKDSIYSIATKSYFATAYKDSKEPGGYVHSGGFLLIDKNRFIRGVYDGTNPQETQRLINDIKILLKE
ncbi:SCO family protein [Flavobacterium marginilacus]|uniref:SCO family protein n=1 Tax=Flavobacterium marginilacus TaxID=3003256 RepID=UPI00248D495C|nr:SCO family protein [Flavobacterium marginilacus]